VRVSVDHLRIVSDDLWNKAAEKLKEFEDKQTARGLGGYNRAKNQAYLYSGLLYCGICGSRMKIGGKQGFGVYECPNYRHGRGCSNGLRIQEDRVAKQITQALANQLFDSEYLNDLVAAVFTELKETWKRQNELAAQEAIPALEKGRRECQVKIDHLIDAIENGGPQRLNAQLEKRSFELGQIETKLKMAKGKSTLNVTQEDLQTLVQKNVANLLDVLKSDVPLARKILFRHFKKLVLFPGVTDAGPVFTVIGEIDLFQAENETKHGVLLSFCHAALSEFRTSNTGGLGQASSRCTWGQLVWKTIAWLWCNWPLLRSAPGHPGAAAQPGITGWHYQLSIPPDANTVDAGLMNETAA
jgi:hypothetical protein